MSLIKNPHFQQHAGYLYHLGIDTGARDIKAEFGDVKFVCLGGTSNRMKRLAELIRVALNLPTDDDLVNLGKPERYSIYKAGPALCVNHGIGMASLSVVLVEVLKLLHHAQVLDPIFIRLGTSGGIGCEPGTVVLTDKCLNGLLQKEYMQYILGREVRFNTEFDQINDGLLAVASENNIPVLVGSTMGVSDFFEEQGRIDGAFCSHTAAEKQQFLDRLLMNGVRNIEMESPYFGSFCRRAGVRGAICCVTLLDRINGDQVTASAETMKEWESRPLRLITAYIKNAV